MPRARWWPCLLLLAACTREPKGTPVALESDDADGGRLDRLIGWNRLADSLTNGGAEMRIGHWDIVTPAPNAQLREALYAVDQELALARACEKSDAPDCISLLETQNTPLGKPSHAYLFRHQVAGALFRKGAILHWLGEPKAALKALDEATELVSDFASSWRIRGLVQLQLQRWQDALESFDHATEKPTTMKYDYLRGIALYHLGKKAEAKALLQSGLQQDPDQRDLFPEAAQALLEFGL